MVCRDMMERKSKSKNGFLMQKRFSAVTDDGSTKLNDCVTQEVPGYTIEACMCTDNLCNRGNNILHSLALLLVPTIALLVATA